MFIIIILGLQQNTLTIFLMLEQIMANLISIFKVHLSGILLMISNGNRTKWSPIRSVIIRVITKSDDRAAGVRLVNHEYDYRPNWTTRSLITN